MDFGKYIGGREDVMLDKRKIRLMTRAAIYEKNYGEEDFKISSYYKKDYSSLNTWVTLIWITVGYGLAVGRLFFCVGGGALEVVYGSQVFFFCWEEMEGVFLGLVSQVTSAGVVYYDK